MADLGQSQALMSDDDKKKQADANSAMAAQGGSGVVGGQAGSGAVSTAGVGAGGTGGWTNIQAYLGANKQDTGSSDYINKKVSDQFSKEGQNLSTAAGSLKEDAQKQAQGIKDTTANADDYLNQAAAAYQWDKPQQNDAYSNIKNTLNNARTGAYSLPNHFDYTMNADTQRIGGNLKDDRGFGQELEKTYQERSGRPMTQGQLDLQRQFDTTNDALGKTRENLLSQYSGLSDKVANTTKDTDSALKKSEQDYRTNQNALNDYLGSEATGTETQVGKELADAKYGYQTARNGTAKNLVNIIPTWMGDLPAWFQTNGPNPFNTNVGSGPNGMNYNQLESYTKDYTDRFGNYLNLSPSYDLSKEPLNPGGDSHQNFAQNIQHGVWQTNKEISDFKNAQQSKYADAADASKKKYNTIMDVLGKDDRKTKGFDVLKG